MQPYRNDQLARPLSFFSLLCSWQESHFALSLANSAFALFHCFCDQVLTCSVVDGSCARTGAIVTTTATMTAETRSECSFSHS